ENGEADLAVAAHIDDVLDGATHPRPEAALQDELVVESDATSAAQSEIDAAADGDRGLHLRLADLDGGAVMHIDRGRAAEAEIERAVIALAADEDTHGISPDRLRYSGGRRTTPSAEP